MLCFFKQYYDWNCFILHKYLDCKGRHWFDLCPLQVSRVVTYPFTLIFLSRRYCIYQNNMLGICDYFPRIEMYYCNQRCSPVRMLLYERELRKQTRKRIESFPISCPLPSWPCSIWPFPPDPYERTNKVATLAILWPLRCQGGASGDHR